MEPLLLITALLMSVGIVLITTPPIVRVAKAKNIFDVSNKRKVHTKSVPTLGGISIFIALTLTPEILSAEYADPYHTTMYAAMIILFFVGIKDDIIFIATRTKLVIQLITALMLVTLGHYSIVNFQGMLGLYQLPAIAGQAFTLLFIVLCINAYNFIDGIDGLASSLGIITSLFFGIWFFINGNFLPCLIAVTLTGSLLGFLYFNLFSKKYSIFMGDTGSTLLGLMIALQVIWFLNLNDVQSLSYSLSTPPVALAVIAIPLLDTLRVLVLRISNGHSPLYPDQKHVHHSMLYFFQRHVHSTLIILGMNVLIIACAMLMSYTTLNINYQFLIILLMGLAATIIPGLRVSFLEKKHGRDVIQEKKVANK